MKPDGMDLLSESELASALSGLDDASQDAGIAAAIQTPVPTPSVEPDPAAPAPSLSQFGNLQSLTGIEVPVIVVLAEKGASLREVLSMTEGSVIMFKKHNSELLSVLVNNRQIGSGKTIKVGERFGIHLRTLGRSAESQ